MEQFDQHPEQQQQQQRQQEQHYQYNQHHQHGSQELSEKVASSLHLLPPAWKQTLPPPIANTGHPSFIYPQIADQPSPQPVEPPVSYIGMNNNAGVNPAATPSSVASAAGQQSVDPNNIIHNSHINLSSGGVGVIRPFYYDLPVPPPPQQQANHNTTPTYYTKPYTPIITSPSSSTSSTSASTERVSTAARSQRKRRRPPHSYASLIAQAILTSPGQRLTLRDIYDWVQRKYPHMYEANEPGWQNTIRHNLSLNRCFCKIPRTSTSQKGKGGFWTVDIAELNNTSFGNQILNSGAFGSYEYWLTRMQQQEQQGQQDHESNLD